MKKYISLLIVLFFLISCSKNNEESVIDETTEIIHGYSDTLESSIKDAKEVKNLIEINQDKLLEDIQKVR